MCTRGKKAESSVTWREIRCKAGLWILNSISNKYGLWAEQCVTHSSRSAWHELSAKCTASYCVIVVCASQSQRVCANMWPCLISRSDLDLSDSELVSSCLRSRLHQLMWWWQGQRVRSLPLDSCLEKIAFVGKPKVRLDKEEVKPSQASLSSHRHTDRVSPKRILKLQFTPNSANQISKKALKSGEA
jgi:hypothetical protein